MTGKELGKITQASFGVVHDYPFLLGLEMTFKLGEGSCVGTGGKYTINVSPECRWEEFERHEAITKMVEFVHRTLMEAKVHDVHSLVGKPVEVTIEGNVFKDFRILTKVL